VSRVRWLALLALVLSGCGGGSSKQHTNTTPRPTTSLTAAAPLNEVLGVPAVGRFLGRCPAGAPSWTLRFVAEPKTASDEVYDLRPGSPVRRTQVDPGATLSWHLQPRAVTSREGPDPVSHSPAATVRTTALLHVVIEQGTEPHIFRVEVRLALAAASDGTANCAPVNAEVQALTYFNGP
jgi:hypothetical protein